MPVQTGIQGSWKLLDSGSPPAFAGVARNDAFEDSTMKIIGKFTRITNPDSLERTHQAFAKILPETPSPSPDGVKTYLDYLAAIRPEAAKANPKEFVDLSFVHEVQASGFIRQLYGK